MKKLLLLLSFIAIFTITFSSCCDNSQNATKPTAEENLVSSKIMAKYMKLDGRFLKLDLSKSEAKSLNVNIVCYNEAVAGIKEINQQIKKYNLTKEQVCSDEEITVADGSVVKYNLDAMIEDYHKFAEE